MAIDKVKVAVRVRPLNRREIELDTKCVVTMDGKQTILYHPTTMKSDSPVISIPDCQAGGPGIGSRQGQNFRNEADEKGTPQSNRKAPKTFAFDHCFWSCNERDPNFAGQEEVFKSLGSDILDNAFQGYNACIFAYGQTGSGKSFTMMGNLDNRGIIPRLCDDLFERIADIQDDCLVFKVEVSYMEIYNERVHDLLDPRGTKQNLRVREHNILGPYVDGLSLLAVSSYEDIDNLMTEGNRSRTVASTNMNSESSRSHAVFCVIVTQTLTDLNSGVSGEKVSKLSLVDLAGSERAQKTGAVGERLKEGSNINKSLTTLGLVISALADQAAGKHKKFVPYRDSVLTWLLKDSLGGNSKTVMVAAISPASDNYEETLSTLRYADRAKRIVNHAVINEDPNARIIRELRAEVEALKEQLKEAVQGEDLKERLWESEKLMQEMTITWEEKLRTTDRIIQERQQALEKMGISVQASGIKVEQNKYYLVNLNADPSLNELLVYYLKERTLVGRPNASVEQDIQLSGLGIMPEHCIITIENTDLFISPLEGARTCVNGSVINSKTLLRHGDRVLWGNNHFFRVNCPKANSPSCAEPERPIDYEFAREELMMKELRNDPIQSAMKALEKQHEEDKQGALEKQRQMYERQLAILRSQMSPGTPSQPYASSFELGRLTPPGLASSVHSRYAQWAKERDELFKKSLANLREDIIKANALVREANFLGEEMGKQTDFHVTLQIPAANLGPNRKRGAFVSEPAILVKRKNKGSQVWSMEKLENKLIDMRDLYQERKEKSLPMKDDSPPKGMDPFYESQENHNLIGVANIFLEVLFHEVKLDYHVPIISQQGEVAGRLQVEISRISGTIPKITDVSSESSGDSKNGSFEADENEGMFVGSQITCRVRIKQAMGLPPSLSNFVFCQYTFWGHPDPMVVPPIVNPDVPDLGKSQQSVSFKFDHIKEFTANVTEEFVEYASEGALSIEVWGHRSTGFGSSKPGWELDNLHAKSRSLADRWSELTRKIELWVEIHELNELGEYTPVEVIPKPDILTGGMCQLRQGQQRRILVRVKPVQNSGTLPIICESITSIAIGSVCARSRLQKGLDSYQEEDLGLLREKWSEALMRRREYLDEQIQKIINKQGKTDQDVEREQSLIDQWVCLTEERNAVLVPAAGSGIPGAPADWESPPGMEKHIPVLFLDLNADDMSTPNIAEGLQAAGANSILPKEHGSKLFSLPIVKYYEKDVCAIAAWDSSIHGSIHLNRVTPRNERVYLILKTVIRLSHPASMELVLRKRLCINVYKKQSIADKIKKKIGKGEYSFQCGVIYEVVSNIPKASEDPEDRESLALIAASGEDTGTSDGESYIEKYTRGVSAVESILTLDRLRQEVAVKELLAAQGRPLRKTASVPNISHMMRLQDSSPGKLEDQFRADSVCDISRISFDSNNSSNSSGFLSGADLFRQLTGGIVESPKDKILNKENKPGSGAPFGLTRPTFLNIRPQTSSSKTPPKGTISPQPIKLVKPMRTLIEEQHQREMKPLLQRNDTEDSFDEDDELAAPIAPSPKKVQTDAGHVSDGSDEFAEYESFHGDSKDIVEEEEVTAKEEDQTVTHSSTTESLAEMQNKSFTPSMSSSGYASQAVSSLTLSSDDNMSMRSMSVDETPDSEAKLLRNQSLEKTASLDHNSEADAPKITKDGLEPALEETELPETELSGTELPESELLQPVDQVSILAEEVPTGDLINLDEDDPQRVSNQLLTDTSVMSPDISTSSNVEILKDLDASPPVKEGTMASSPWKFEKIPDENQNSEEALADTPSGEQVSDNEDDVKNKSDPLTRLHISEEDLCEDADSEEQAKALANRSEDHINNNALPCQLNERQLSDLDIMDSPKRTPNGDQIVTSPQLPNDKPVQKRHNVTRVSTSQRASFPFVHSSSEGVRGSRVSLEHQMKQAELELGLHSENQVVDDPLSPPYDYTNSSLSRSSSGLTDDTDVDDGMSTCSFGSRADLHRLSEVPIPSWVIIGEAVIITPYQKSGVVQFIGTTEFASGNWVGVELDTPFGKNDGSVRGIRYFKCKPKHGIFVRADKLAVDKKRRSVRPRSMGVSTTLNRRSLNSSLTDMPSSSTNSLFRPTVASTARKADKK